MYRGNLILLPIFKNNKRKEIFVFYCQLITSYFDLMIFKTFSPLVCMHTLAGEDYESTNSSSLLFDDNTPLEPFQVRILQDNLTERTESFSAALTRVVSISVGGVQGDFTEMDTSRILFSPATARIDILDNDGKICS